LKTRLRRFGGFRFERDDGIAMASVRSSSRWVMRRLFCALWIERGLSTVGAKDWAIWDGAGSFRRVRELSRS